MALSFPDVNVWLAVLLHEHVHHEIAKSWWQSDNSEAICFTRITQMSVLRLLTTSVVMNGKPLTMKAAWKTYDRLLDDDRVCYSSEAPDVEKHFRLYTSNEVPSPKVWADCWLLAMALSHGGSVITFDPNLAAKTSIASKGSCLLLS